MSLALRKYFSSSFVKYSDWDASVTIFSESKFKFRLNSHLAGRQPPIARFSKFNLRTAGHRNHWSNVRFIYYFNIFIFWIFILWVFDIMFVLPKTEMVPTPNLNKAHAAGIVGWVYADTIWASSSYSDAWGSVPENSILWVTLGCNWVTGCGCDRVTNPISRFLPL